jgi:predicted ATPase
VERASRGGFLRSVRLETRPDAPLDYATDLPAIANMGELPLDPAATFLVGANGSGKSTLLEAIAVAAGCNAEGGSRNFRFSTNATHATLHRHLTLVRDRRPQTDFFLRAESFYNVATEVDQLDVTSSYGGRSLHQQSHGESFLALVINRFGARGLYFLDEPEAALSLQGQLTLLRRMHELVEHGSQFVVATHSPVLLALPNATIFQMTDAGPRPIAYDDVEHVVLYRSFLADPQRFLHYLLADDDE